MRRSPVCSAICLFCCAVIVLLAEARGQSAPVRMKSQESFPGKSWQHTPSLESAGWSKEKLAASRDYGDSIHSSAVMIVQGGQVVDQWGDTDKKISSYSVRKSLLSALYGIYSAEGVIDVNQTLEQLGIDDSPDPLTKQERQARVVDLLRARSGVYHAVDFETDFMKKNRPACGSHAPGTFWYYNNWDFNTLGTIFEKKTGLKIAEAFYQRIAKPIGMEDFQPGDVYYLGGPLSLHSAYHFEMTARARKCAIYSFSQMGWSAISIALPAFLAVPMPGQESVTLVVKGSVSASRAIVQRAQLNPATTLACDCGRRQQ
jgi:CubicO group peptidase (beta-lactamase class C family)